MAKISAIDKNKKRIYMVGLHKEKRLALKVITQKKLGTLIVRNKNGITTGIITDGQIRRVNQKNDNLHILKVKNVMTTNPIKIDKEILVEKALSIMNLNKVTCLSVYDKKNKLKTVGILHVHSILGNNIS